MLFLSEKNQSIASSFYSVTGRVKPSTWFSLFAQKTVTMPPKDHPIPQVYPKRKICCKKANICSSKEWLLRKMVMIRNISKFPSQLGVYPEKGPVLPPKKKFEPRRYVGSFSLSRLWMHVFPLDTRKVFPPRAPPSNYRAPWQQPCAACLLCLDCPAALSCTLIIIMMIIMVTLEMVILTLIMILYFGCTWASTSTSNSFCSFSHGKNFSLTDIGNLQLRWDTYFVLKSEWWWWRKGGCPARHHGFLRQQYKTHSRPPLSVQQLLQKQM